MPAEKSSEKKLLKGIIIGIGVVSIGGGLAPLLLDTFSDDGPMTSNENIIVEVQEQAEVTIPPAAPQPIEVVTKTQSKVESPPPPAAETKITLPHLLESDPFVLEKIASTTEEVLFNPNDMINNIVVFVDNFSRGELVSNFSPLVKPNGSFSVTKQNGVLTIDSDSYRRYDSYANAVETIDVENFIDFYSLLSPLIDEAYQEIGYSAGAFNGTFEKAIDHLLQTPIIHYQLEVIAPSVTYQYADESLESLPDTQKLMLRMGPDNLQIVQEKLREIKSELQRL